MEGSPEYKRSWLDRAGPDGVNVLRARVGAVFVFCFALLAVIGKMGFSFTSVGLGALLGSIGAFAVLSIPTAAGAVAKGFTLPSGNSTPYEQQFSYQEAMIMKGEIAEALESYEAIIAENPQLVSPRMRAAEHYVKGNRNPTRAAELFREIRDIPGVPSRDAVYASSRLVDLYEGPLADPGRAVVELRRIIERYPGSAMAKHAREALPAMKARMAID